jgi:DNA-binding LacI/PurR family transcriptional regulator
MADWFSFPDLAGDLAGSLRAGEVSFVPTAIFASSDLMAIGAIHAINEAGLCVPDDISIVGVDNIEQAEFTVPPLTTILQPLDRIGEQGVRLLLELVDGRQIENPHVVIEPTLLARNSTTVPRRYSYQEGRVVRY